VISGVKAKYYFNIPKKERKKERKTEIQKRKEETMRTIGKSLVF